MVDDLRVRNREDWHHQKMTRSSALTARRSAAKVDETGASCPDVAEG
jgi:hypothetical protein